MKFSFAICREVPETFAQGLTEANLGVPDISLARSQHEAYCSALLQAGVQVSVLPALPELPDSVFVEDVALIEEGGYVLCRPGADSRLAEVDPIRRPLADRWLMRGEISHPGTLEGGDVCDAEEAVFVGLSNRTNQDGIQQLAQILSRRVIGVDLPSKSGILHLKSGISYLGDRVFICDSRLLDNLQLPAGSKIIELEAARAYAANCIRVNDLILIAQGYAIENEIRDALPSVDVVALDMSEFKKMDGGLSCLSLRG